MGKYIHLFETEGGFNAVYNGEGYVEPWVSYTEENTEVNYNKSEYEKLLGTPLTFEITGDGNIVWQVSNTAFTKTIEYKKNDGEWTSITSNTYSSAPSISVAAGDTVQFRGDNATYGTASHCNTFSGSTAQFKVKGNIMSLIDSTNFSRLTTLSSTFTFSRLIQNCTGLTDASELLLPATTLKSYCYRYMFVGCTSLTTAPELPATTLVEGCYESMFPTCASLTTAPELFATTLARRCYNGMFSGCRRLNYIKCLATDISASDCTSNWVSGVDSIGTFVKAPSMTGWTTGDNGVPANWTVQDAS